MSPRDRDVFPSKIRGFLRGLGELAEFLRESGLAVVEVAISRWPQPFGAMRRKRKASGKGPRLIEKIAPFPTED